MEMSIHDDAAEAGAKAASLAIRKLRVALAERAEANLILATGASQFAMLQELVSADLDWNRITCFHLDEYIGLSETHPASFRHYLQERFVDQVSGVKEFYWVQGDSSNPAAECKRLGEIIQRHPIDVACIGIGENGHLAFNDPPADFETDDPYLVVELDENCRRQQFGEGWFPSLEKVPAHAISMSVQQIMRSSSIICTVPDERKAEAVKAAVEGAGSPQVPASILQEHPDVSLLLDSAAASLLAGPQDAR